MRLKKTLDWMDYCLGPMSDEPELQKRNFYNFVDEYKVLNRKINKDSIVPFSIRSGNHEGDFSTHHLLDHCQGFLSDTHKIMTSQPYADMDEVVRLINEDNIVTEYMRLFDIEVDIKDKTYSWHAPNNACVLIFLKKDRRNEISGFKKKYGITDWRF